MALITRSERHIMRALYKLVGEKSSGLVTVDALWDNIPKKRYLKWLRKNTNLANAQAGKVFVKDKPVNKGAIKELLYSLSYAEYFELTTATGKDILLSPAGAKKRRRLKKSDSAQEEEQQPPQPQEREVFVISLKDRGKNFPREESDRVKGLVLKIVSTVAFAVLSVTVTMILRAILSGG